MILEKGGPSAASAALCKTAMSELFDSEMSDFLSESFYASEKPRTDVNTLICKAYRRAITERKDFWMELLEKELPVRWAVIPSSVSAIRRSAVPISR